MKKLVVLLVIASQLGINAYSQKTVVIMGSSTAAGSDATANNAWWQKVRANYRKNTGDGVDTNVVNIAGYGQTTYHQMPTGYTPPAGRPAPDPLTNITRALSYNPDIVLINLPSNDVAEGFSKKEMMDNLRYLFGLVVGSGKKCYITTTQPRNDQTDSRRLALRELVDSISNNFGNYHINFWDDLVIPVENRLKPEVVTTNQLYEFAYHLNDVGHDFLYNRVIARNIFTDAGVVPVKLKQFKGHLKNGKVELSWKVEMEETSTTYNLERSNNGIDFSPLYATTGKHSQAPISYTWTDELPLTGKSFYRLRISENAGVTYSNVVSIVNAARWSVKKVYSQNQQQLVADLTVDELQMLEIKIHSYSGVLMYSKKLRLAAGQQEITIPIINLTSGQYVLTIRGVDSKYTHAFFK